METDLNTISPTDKAAFPLQYMITAALSLSSAKRLLYPLLRGIAYGALISILFLVGMWLFCLYQVYQTSHNKIDPSQHADAAVVLGAAAWDKNPSPVFRERINHAITLYQSGKVEKLIFTGGTPKPGYMTEAEVGRRYALKQGVPSSDILFENTSRDTYQNLANIRPLLHDNNLDTIIIISDPFHLARAQAIADSLGLHATTSATPTSAYTDEQKRRQFLLQESYALFAYYWAHWLDNVPSVKAAHP